MTEGLGLESATGKRTDLVKNLVWQSRAIKGNRKRFLKSKLGADYEGPGMLQNCTIPPALQVSS